MTDTDRLEQIRLLEAALAERNAELQRVRDQRDALRAKRDEARRELCRWSSFYYEEHIDINEGPPRARDREEAARRGWDCFKDRGWDCFEEDEPCPHP